MHGPVAKVVPFGVFVRVADGIEGLVHLSELAVTPVGAPGDVVQIGDEVTVITTGIDLRRRRLALSRRQAAEKIWDLPPTASGNPSDPAG
ncbi:S1 RNA-binding domain-containing protein [Nonomuraea jabiensis]|uniref:S1 RNA-binding domain-containing protein n=1 Tax=Nonomuraea jabiensis TaxID=882448 RepID=UPI00368ED60A